MIKNNMRDEMFYSPESTSVGHSVNVATDRIANSLQGSAVTSIKIFFYCLAAFCNFIALSLFCFSLRRGNKKKKKRNLIKFRLFSVSALHVGGN